MSFLSAARWAFFVIVNIIQFSRKMEQKHRVELSERTKKYLWEGKLHLALEGLVLTHKLKVHLRLN